MAGRSVHLPPRARARHLAGSRSGEIAPLADADPRVRQESPESLLSCHPRKYGVQLASQRGREGKATLVRAVMSKARPSVLQQCSHLNFGLDWIVRELGRKRQQPRGNRRVDFAVRRSVPLELNNVMRRAIAEFFRAEAMGFIFTVCPIDLEVSRTNWQTASFSSSV